MPIADNLFLGFSVALQPLYLLTALVGAVLGTVVGVLPGLGPLGAMAILLSFTLKMDATAAMILFAGIYYGAMYGGSTTSILFNIPGEAASVVTCIDGYEMAKKGRAGAALTVAAVGSFIAGTISIIGLMFAASLLANVGLRFGPPEFFAIGLCALIILVRLSSGSLFKSVIMVVLGVAVGTVGMDPFTADKRFTFGIYELGQGIDFLPIAMGLFGIAEVMEVATRIDSGRQQIASLRLRDLLPTRGEWKRSFMPMIRGSFLGFLIGLIPGPAPTIASFVSYITEKKVSKHPEEFGNGAIEGVAGPEAANNAAVGGSYIPLLGLGIPFSPHMAILLGALMLHGITPGPTMISEKPMLFWGLIASMYVGNVMLLVLNVPLVKVFVSVMKVPEKVLIPLVMVFCIVGVYSINSSYVDLMVLAVFGIAGYIMRWLDFEPAPLVLAVLIGPMLESAFRQSMKMTRGDITEMLFRPICLGLYLTIILAFVAPVLVNFLRRWRHRRFPTGETSVAVNGRVR
jgi:putative tricarboxylic transport membrane protein